MLANVSNTDDNECTALTQWSNTCHVKEATGYNDLTARYSLCKQKLDSADKVSKGKERSNNSPPSEESQNHLSSLHVWYV